VRDVTNISLEPCFPLSTISSTLPPATASGTYSNKPPPLPPHGSFVIAARIPRLPLASHLSLLHRHNHVQLAPLLRLPAASSTRHGKSSSQMTLKKGPSSANNTAPPYPLTPEEQARLSAQDYADNNSNTYRMKPYSPPAALASPDFHMRDVSDTLPTPQQSKGKGLELPGSLRAGGASKIPPRDKEKEIPDSLRVGGGGSGRVSPVGDRSDGEVKRSSSELRRSYQRGEVPDILRAGAGRKSAELQRPASPVLPASPMAPSAPKSMSVPLAPTAPPLLPLPASSPAPVPQTLVPQTPQPIQATPSSNHCKLRPTYTLCDD